MTEGQAIAEKSARLPEAGGHSAPIGGAVEWMANAGYFAPTFRS